MKNILLGMDSDVGFLAQVQFEHLREITEDTIISTERYTLSTSLYALASAVKTAMRQASDKPARVQGDENNACFVMGDKVWAYVTKGAGSRPLDSTRSSHSVTVWGLVDLVAETLEIIDSTYKKGKVNTVQWAYTSKHGLYYKTIVVDPPHDIAQEYYPFIPDVLTYFQRFMDSESQVLLMTGPPGTGKTSLLRWALAHHSLGATITYEEQLVKDDELFVDFLTSTESDVLVFEDVDILLSSREQGDNRVMSKFLNVSDGLVKFPRKKIVFSTNLQDVSRVDNALTRPGRCFDAPEFRLLSHREAEAAARAAGIEEAPGGECSLAQLFNQGSKKYAHKMGFVDPHDSRQDKNTSWGKEDGSLAKDFEGYGKERGAKADDLGRKDSSPKHMGSSAIGVE